MLKAVGDYFSRIYLRHKRYWTQQRAVSFGVALLVGVIALSVQKVADTYVGDLHGVYVPDLLLDHLPTLDIDGVIIQGALLMTAAGVFLVASRPKYLPFALKTVAVFFVTRAIFISLTHMGVSPRELQFDTTSADWGLYNYLFNTHNDFFFSAHTGLPFLIALIFWKERYWRYIFLAASFVMGWAVLFAHIHYSIDVFAAPFMAYSIFAASKHLFAKDYKELELKD